MAGFEVLKKLIDGCAAEAFLARQQGTSHRVVVEILKPELPPELSKRFVHEATALLALEHPHLVRRAHLGKTADGRPFAVTEPLEGESLTATLWSLGSLEPEDVLKLAIPLCDALEYLHQAGLVHGGVSADNVYLPGGLGAHHPKLLDFRLALLWGGKADPTAGATPRLEYLSPECLAGQTVDARADIYAMGILIYEALSGFPPFAGSTPQDVLRKQRRGVPALPTSCERLARIVQRCLQLERSERFASSRELSDELAREEVATGPITPAPAIRAKEIAAPPAVAEPETAGDGTLEASSTPPARRRRGRKAATYATVAIAALAAIGAGWLSRKKPVLAARAPGTIKLLPFSRAMAKTASSSAVRSETAPPNAVRLEVTSEPPGALVVWAKSGEALGRTPLTTSVPRQQDEPTVRIELAGYRPVSRKIKLDADATAHAKLKSAAEPTRKKAVPRRHHEG